MKKAIFLLFVITTLISLVYATEFTPSPIIELNTGQNATINMEEFSRQTVRIYEGSTINLNIQNDFGDIPLTIHIQEIKADGNIRAEVGQRDKKLQPFLLTLGGNATQIRLDHPKIKALFLEATVLHYTPDAKERNIQLFINIPLFSTYTGKLPYDEPATKTKEQPAPVSQMLEKDPYVKYFLIAIVILILALLFLKPKNKKK